MLPCSQQLPLQNEYIGTDTAEILTLQQEHIRINNLKYNR